MELIKNPHVVFTEEPHRYTLLKEDFSSQELSGITAIIKTTICPDLYKDVAEDVLKKAAAHGTHCHKLCEQFDNAEFHEVDEQGTLADELENTITDNELYMYRQIIRDNNLSIIASEYLVSDNCMFASCIDKVAMLSETEAAIIDLKFTYQYHEEPVTWQTSFYADLFELQNPTIKVKKLYCIHIHQYKDQCKGAIHELERLPKEWLANAVQHHLDVVAGKKVKPFVNPHLKVTIPLPKFRLTEARTISVLKKFKDIEKEKEEIVNFYKEQFKANPMANKLEGKHLTFSQSEPSTKVVFDEALFAAENPELYRKYCTKYKITSARTTFTIKD